MITINYIQSHAGSASVITTSLVVWRNATAFFLVSSLPFFYVAHGRQLNHRFKFGPRLRAVHVALVLVHWFDRDFSFPSCVRLRRSFFFSSRFLFFFFMPYLFIAMPDSSFDRMTISCVSNPLQCLSWLSILRFFFLFVVIS